MRTEQTGTDGTEESIGSARDSAFFDRWYTELQVSPVRDTIVARCLGAPDEYVGTTGCWAGRPWTRSRPGSA